MNQTLSTYDMRDRRTEVNHPASGITSFTYDALGNVLTKQTANMAEEGKMITYTYDYHRFTGINYPDHPENNVKYYYGGRNASHNRIGRLMLREDGTGAIEYFYGKMGEVTKTRRTLIVPNQAIATYVTQWTYDSHNRLVEMIYPDEEKVTYSYNLGGILEKVRGEKSYGYDYISKLGYDKFERCSYLKYYNDAETFYTFDGLYRLTSATGTYTVADSESASYTLDMVYDNLHRITSKRQHLTQDNVQFNGTLNVGYDLSYTYSSEEGKKFQLESVKDVNYRTEETPEGNNVENGHVYTYDKNGNLVYVNTSRMMNDGHKDNSVGERKLIWDEENRLLSVDDNGFVSNYWYDADGERTVKTSGESDQVYVNGVFSGGSTNTAKFSLYVSPYLVANQGGRYTKHIYAGSQRIVSKVGDFASYGSDPRRIEYAGSETDGLSVDYKSKYTAQQQIIKDHYTFFDVPYNGTDNNNYADGEGFCCNDGTLEAAQAKAMRKVQSRAVAKSFKDPDNYENLQFFYHPDHLGSSSFITNLDGEVVQHIEYVPFGEVFIEERNSVWNTPYLFNAKEFDEETGLYYYGARYYEPRLSLWMSTDPMSELMPNKTAYKFSNNNPIRFIDPTGLYETEQDARNAAKQFNNAPVHMDLASGEWFLSLNAEGNDAYVSGPVLTRYFGDKKPSWTSALYIGSVGVSYWKETQYNTTLEIWRGKNNKIYHGLSGRGPNQYTGSRSLAHAKSTKIGYASNALTAVSVIVTQVQYEQSLKEDLGPNMRHYLRDKCIRDQVFNFSGAFGGVYGTAASIGYNLGYLIEDVGQWLTNNPDFRIRLNPYTMDFTPIEKTLQEYDELGIIIY